jgi:hypothetical protein
MRRATCLLAFVVGLGASGGCGDADDAGLSGAAGTGGSIPLEDVAEKYAAAICAAYRNCMGEYHDALSGREDCETLYQRSIEDRYLSLIEQAIEDGTITYHGDRVQGCLDDVTGRSCAELNDRSSACDGVFEGSAKDGDDCELDEECPAGSFCKREASCPGSCAPRAGAGDDCFGENDHCQSGLVCSETTDKCVQPAGEGEACEGGSYPNCAPGLICAGQRETPQPQPGACTPPDQVFVNAEGADCDLEATKLCKVGLSCTVSLDPGPPPRARQTCEKPLGSGAECTLGVPDRCPDDEYCDLGPDPGNFIGGTCKPLLGPGEACGAARAGNACQAYSVCDGGTCKEMQRLGGSCDKDELCYSGNCEAGACAVPDLCKP